MTGLRARQKADRSRRIIEAAAALFREQGYEATRIEDIAARAEVSEGTAYNYFQTKGDLLVAIVSHEVEEVLQAGQRVIDAVPGDVQTALDALCEVYFDHSLIYLSKEMWRQAMAFSIATPDAPYGQRYTELDGLLRDQVCALLCVLQARGLVRVGVDIGAVGEMVFNNLNMMFIEFTKSGMPVSAIKAAVSRQNAPLARLIAVPQKG
jgi:AcrR family transcriptional regulator